MLFRSCRNQRTFTGTPALVVIRGVLYVLCGAADREREILGYQYDHISSRWTPCDDVSGGRAASGVSATSLGDETYLGFIQDRPGNTKRAAYVSAFVDGKWQPQEAVAGQSAAGAPQIAILNGRMHCIFNDESETGDLRWYSRPVLSYSPSSWMGDIADDALISHLTIPGTHDSCARSNFPFVRTQYLSITQQLALGIRFLDLRLRLHDDGNLFCYHGGVPLGYPPGLSFTSVMDEVWIFLRGPDGTGPTTETVLVSINNDNHSPDQHTNPAPFYRAVESAIAATSHYPDGIRKWFVGPGTPALGQARGRAILLRRYKGDPALDPRVCQGLDLSRWLNNNPEFTIVTPTNIKIHLQDKWRYAQRITLAQLVTSKSGHVQQLMERTADGGPAAPTGGREGDDWFINFCSAVGDPAEHGEVAEPKWIAVGAHSDWIGKWVVGMNVRTRDYIQGLQNQSTGTSKRRLGIVILDYPELPLGNDLVERLVEMNF